MAGCDPFHLNGSRNVAWDDGDYQKEHLLQMCGTYAEVDVVSYPYDLADHFAEGSLDYVLSAHVLQEVQDLFRVLDAVETVLKEGGIFFCILPLPDALETDKDRPRTTVEELQQDYEAGKNGSGYRTFSGRHVWSLPAFVNAVGWHKPRWDLEFTEDKDSKVGNGFTAVFRIRKPEPTRLEWVKATFADRIAKAEEDLRAEGMLAAEESLEAMWRRQFEEIPDEELPLSALESELDGAETREQLIDNLVAHALEYSHMRPLIVPQEEMPFGMPVDENGKPDGDPQAWVNSLGIETSAPGITGTLTIGDQTYPIQDAKIEPPGPSLDNMRAPRDATDNSTTSTPPPSPRTRKKKDAK